MKYKAIKHKVQLLCGHESWYRVPIPQPGDIVYCVRCEASKKVLANSLFAYHAICEKCHWKHHGNIRGYMMKAAERHHQKFKTHSIVRIYSLVEDSHD